MKSTKKLISILLSSIFLCPNICAMKSSVSMPEGLCQHGRDDISAEEMKEVDTSLYSLYKRCQHIIVTASDTHTTAIINNVAYICAITFGKISDLLRSKDGLNKRYYASCLKNYVPLIEGLNHVLLDIIPYKTKATDPCFPASDETKENVRAAERNASLAIAKYGDIFSLEISATFLEPTPVQQMYDLLCDTNKGISYVAGLSSLRV